MNTSLQAWNALDWLLAGIVLFSTLAGLLRGLIRTLFGLAGLFCGFAVATWQYRAAAAWVEAKGWIASPDIASAVSYITIAIVVMIVVGVIGGIVRRAAHAVGLGLVDRILGGALGTLRGVLVGGAITLAIRAIAPTTELLRHSRLSSYFLAAAHAISFVVPHSLR